MFGGNIMKIKQLLSNKTDQVKRIETVFEWLESCPYEYQISSMQGEKFLFVKIDMLTPYKKDKKND
jgi:hypothetical protein